MSTQIYKNTYTKKERNMYLLGMAGQNIALQKGASFKDDFPQYAMMMFFLCSIPPAIGLLLSIIPMKKYPLTNADNKKILASLVERREKVAAEAQTADENV